MQVDYRGTEQMVRALAERAGLVVSDRALLPLKRLSFEALVDIYDHEEAFLKQVFESSLIEAHEARRQGGQDDGQITIEDVRTALLMLGAAAANTDESTLSSRSKTRIKSICPYCMSAASEAGGEEVMAE